MGPIVVEIHWYRQLRLVETDNMALVVMDELPNDMVFILTVEASNVEADHFSSWSSSISSSSLLGR